VRPISKSFGTSRRIFVNWNAMPSFSANSGACGCHIRIHEGTSGPRFRPRGSNTRAGVRTWRNCRPSNPFQRRKSGHGNSAVECENAGSCPQTRGESDARNIARHSSVKRGPPAHQATPLVPFASTVSETSSTSRIKAYSAQSASRLACGSMKTRNKNCSPNFSPRACIRRKTV